jgi:hypothetical protein
MLVSFLVGGPRQLIKNTFLFSSKQATYIVQHAKNMPLMALFPMLDIKQEII